MQQRNLLVNTTCLQGNSNIPNVLFYQIQRSVIPSKLCPIVTAMCLSAEADMSPVFSSIQRIRR